MDFSATSILLGLVVIAAALGGGLAIYLGLRGEEPAVEEPGPADTGRHHVPEWLLDGDTRRLGPDVVQRSRADQHQA
ncbi:hypothetical protein [Actinoplanes friuliensis]|jgi:hypothetical protein|uniref:Uncharacterized protein n=1 Tax=Actinoplanes friuliensis DSM 7358 TaxID=1246995 RepID=U5W1G5_9ACTN|nr:hypothetical protein [Actinoplanes friuliensis]AGZ41756.1 hypothetical protein AFR_17390 [Actinoplanes friuliensis DSM 7358]